MIQMMEGKGRKDVIVSSVSHLGEAILGPDEDSELPNFQITGKVGDFYSASAECLQSSWGVLKLA